MANNWLYDDILLRALAEDIGAGDITTLATVPEDKEISGRFIAKKPGIICGLDIAKRVFELLDPNVTFTAKLKDGESAGKSTVIATVSGNARSILSGERVALNLLQHLSGIATATAKAVAAVAGYKAVIADTRKTTPGLRVLEKYAVRTGGGTHHRYNLADGVLIKDNHIAAAGGITRAISLARKSIPHTLKIEVETETLEQVQEALDSGADIIMLDNMSVQDMKAAVELIAGRAIVEASGNMGERNLAEVAATGVDIISIGALTHDVDSIDISLKFD